MQITQDELNRRLNSTSNLRNKIVPVAPGAVAEVTPEKPTNKGNDENNRNNCGRLPEMPNAPSSLRIVAGVLAKAENNAAAVARNLNLTPGQVRYAVDSPQTKITEKQVQDIALTRLMDTLGLLTDDVIRDEKPKDIAAIAANLSRVHKNLAPNREGDKGNSVNITIYSPKLRTIDDYETIEVQTGT